MQEIFELIQNNDHFLILGYGLLVGIIHAFEPDHISVMSNQLLAKSNSSKKINVRKISISSSLRGMFWGMGHMSSILLIGLLIAGLSLSIPSSFFMGSELIVGIMLLFLATTMVFKKSAFRLNHIHPHSHGDKIHTHPHEHKGEHSHNHKSYLIGCIQGMAGSGGAVALAASTFESVELMLVFLALFGIGCIVGMSSLSGLLGIPFAFISNIGKFMVYLRYTVITATFGIGTFIIYDIIGNISKTGFV